MISKYEGIAIYKLRHTRKDIGVIAIAILALLGGLLLKQSITGKTMTFADKATGLQMTYPAAYAEASTMLPDAVIKVADQYGASAVKSSLTVEALDIDKSNIPTLQQLMDRRVELRGKLTGYHFIGNKETSVSGNKAMQLDYAYVDQPLDQPRRVSLPVVVEGREYIVLGKDRVYYLTLAAPEKEADTAMPQLQKIVESLKIQ